MEDRAALSKHEREAVVSALKAMSRKPSSQPQAARLIGFTQQHVNNAIRLGRMGFDVRDAVIGWLAEHGVIRDATVQALLERYGSAAVREHWTWEKLLATQDAWPERQIAKKQARSLGVPVDAAARVCTKPPWVSREFQHRTVKWWAEEMRRVAADEAKRREMSPEEVAELVHQEYELQMKAG